VLEICLDCIGDGVEDFGPLGWRGLAPRDFCLMGSVERHPGPLMFFQSGGCCDGSLPMCFELGALLLGDNDLLLGLVGGCPFYIDRHQYEAWGRPGFTLDVAPGLPEGFSLPAGPQEHFVVTSKSESQNDRRPVATVKSRSNETPHVPRRKNRVSLC
jgi:uncharacterized protein